MRDVSELKQWMIDVWPN